MFCPHCGTTYGPGDIAYYIRPSLCPRCGSHRLHRWDVICCLDQLLRSMAGRRRVP